MSHGGSGRNAAGYKNQSIARRFTVLSLEWTERKRMKMGLDLFFVEANGSEDHQNLIWSIDDRAYGNLSDVIGLFRSRTGYYIDQYDDLKIKGGNLGPLLGAIRDTMTNTPHNSEKYRDTQKLCDVVNSAKDQDKGLIFVGD
jgi:hypothetical protein